jgi:DNA-binding NarL/FixJ family response regulator
MGIVSDTLSSEFIRSEVSPVRSASERTVHQLSGTLTSKNAEVVAIIHSSRLFRDCLRRALCAATTGLVVDYASVEAWGEAGHDGARSIILIGLPRGSNSEDDMELQLVLARANGANVVATGESEDPAYILDLLSKGVRGYIPSSLALDVSIGALQIVRAGGVFVPANCLLAMPKHPAPAPQKQGLGMFTAKQIAVIDAIRQGKANKTIAYELNMCESTVKVHVRNIMKKMQATNRTQVAFIANRILTERSDSEGARQRGL